MVNPQSENEENLDEKILDVDENIFMESTFVEIQYETYEKDQYYGEIRRLSKPNDVLFIHKVVSQYIKKKNECIDYVSDENTLYMNNSFI